MRSIPRLVTKGITLAGTASRVIVRPIRCVFQFWQFYTGRKGDKPRPYSAKLDNSQGFRKCDRCGEFIAIRLP